jgi:hypothetical protein
MASQRRSTVESGRAQVGERLKPTDCKSVRLLAFGGSNPPLCTSISLARLVPTGAGDLVMRETRNEAVAGTSDIRRDRCTGVADAGRENPFGQLVDFGLLRYSHSGAGAQGSPARARRTAVAKANGRK